MELRKTLLNLHLRFDAIRIFRSLDFHLLVKDTTLQNSQSQLPALQSTKTRTSALTLFDVLTPVAANIN